MADGVLKKGVDSGALTHLQLGRIEYVDSRDAEQNEFYVPRVIERFGGRSGKGRTVFPRKD